MISRTSNAPLPFSWQVAFTAVGAVVVRASFELTESGAAANAAGLLLLVLLLITQRRLALLRPDRSLSSPEQVRGAAVALSLAFVVLTAAASIWADRALGEGWGPVALFVGVVTTADFLVRRSAANPVGSEAGSPRSGRPSSDNR